MKRRKMKYTTLLTTCCRSVIIAAIIGLCHSTTPASENGDPSDATARKMAGERIRNATNVVCGPQCAKFILEHYHIKSVPDIVAITRTLQGKHILQGTTLSALGGYLNKSGVHTLETGLTGSARLTWPHPVIVHLQSNRPGELGHFVVWLPSSSDPEVHYWDNIRGNVRVAPSQWEKQRSGSILLTSPTPIESIDGVAVYAGLESDSLYTRILGIIVFAIGLVACGFSFSPLIFPSREKKPFAAEE